MPDYRTQRMRDPDSRDRERSIQELLAVNRRFYEAFEKLDLSIMDDVWVHSALATCMHPSPGWALLRGWEDVRASWVQIFSRLRAIRFELSDLRVVVAENFAWIILTERLWAYSLDLEGEIVEATIATNLFERAGSTWKMLHHHATLYLEDPEAAKIAEEEPVGPSTLTDAFDDIPLQAERQETIRRSPRERRSTRDPNDSQG